MTTIPRYLIAQFMRVFLMTFCSLLGVYVIADCVGNFSEFVDYGKESDSLALVLANYYGARVPWFFDLAGRNVALLAAVLSLAWLRRDNEMTALMAAGISRWRIARPLIWACVLIAGLGAVNREFWVPRFRSQLCRTAQDLIRNHPEKITPRYDPQTDILLDGQAIYQLHQEIREPRFRLPLQWDSVGRKLSGDTATYVSAVDGRPGGYLVANPKSSIPLSNVPPLIIKDVPAVLTPRDTPWLKPNEAFVVSNVSLDQLRRGRQWQQLTATKPLIAGIQSGSIDHAPDVRVMIHSRFVQPFLDITLVFLGLPLVLRDNGSRQVILQAAKSLVAIVVFAVVVLISHGLGIQGAISPSLAAWAPLIVLVPCAFLVSEPLRR